MGFFKFNRKNDVLDLTEHFRKQQAKVAEMRADMEKGKAEDNAQGSGGGMFGIFGGSQNTENTGSNDYVEMSSPAEETRKKLAKRLMDMTEKIEDLSNQIYHMQQRIEVLERKNGVNEY